MVSIIVAVTLAILIGIIVGIFDKTISAGVIMTIVGLWIAFFSFLIIGAIYTPPVIDFKDYELYNVGNGLVYINEDGTPKSIDNSNYTVEVDKDISKPVKRILKYDNTYVAKADKTIILLPDNYFQKIDA